MENLIILKFKAGQYGKPIATHDGKTVLLDRHSEITPKVQAGEEWECAFVFEPRGGSFKVFKPITKVGGKAIEPAVKKVVDDKEFKPSTFQQNIYDCVDNEECNIVCSAVAGSGKTTTLLNMLKRIPHTKSVLFLAFNKSIVAELKSRVPHTMYNVDIKTVHGFGSKAMQMAYKSELVKTKYKDIAKTISVGWNLKENEKEEYVNRVLKLADLGRLSLVRNKIQLELLANKHDIGLTDGECERAIDLIRIGMKDTKTIDFTDMVFMPNALKVTVKQYEIVFVDEAQDLNACQRELMLKAIKPGGKFIAVGDPKQAIYGFAGADVESFQKLINQPNTKQLPLSICYRCDTSIVKEAKALVPQIEARDGAQKGIIDRDAKISDIRSSDLVLCRNTFPLVSLCIKYLSKGIRAHVVGKDIGTNLIKMIEYTKEIMVIDVFKKLDMERIKIESNIMMKHNMSPREARETSIYQGYVEKIDVIEIISKGMERAHEVITKIMDIFDDNNTSGIILSTIHKAKGLESDRVFIICEELMPSKWAKMDWQKEQEMNLIYVAYTRAKHELCFVTDFDPYAAKNL